MDDIFSFGAALPSNWFTILVMRRYPQADGGSNYWIEWLPVPLQIYRKNHDCLCFQSLN